MTLADASGWFAADANHERGEFVLLIDVSPNRLANSPDKSAIDTRALLVALLAELPPSRAARVAAAATGLPRDGLYAQALSVKRD
jgi:16S rRNA (cytidine1402-2'-O)-methyltransferase